MRTNMKTPGVNSFNLIHIAFPAMLFVLSRSALLLIAVLSSGNQPLSETLYQWDTGWYHGLAEYGYHSKPNAHENGDAANWAFFPLYPMLIRLLANTTGLQIQTAGIVLSNTAFAITLILLYRYTLQLTGKQTAQTITALAAVSPFSLYYSVMYTEALYTSLMIALMLSARNKHWITAGVLGVFLSATRNLGVMIVFPMLAIAVSQYGWTKLLTLRKGTEPALFAIIIAPLGLFIYMLFLYNLTGDALAFSHIQRAWGREIGNPLINLLGGFSNSNDPTIYNAILACLGITGGIYLWRKQLQPEALILLTGTLIPLSTGLWSLHRYIGTLFPFMIFTALLVRSRWWLKGITFAVFIYLFIFYIRSWTAGKGYMI